MRPEPAEWSGDEFELDFPHGTPLMIGGRLQAATRDATFLASPDTRTIKATHVVVASQRLAIGSGNARGLAAACQPRHIMIDYATKNAADVHPNGRCARPGCAQLFEKAK